MPTESEQSNLQQPWKAWYAALDPMGRQDIREGNFTWKAGEGDHGTVAVSHTDVDLWQPKEVPKPLVHIHAEDKIPYTNDWMFN